VKGVIVWEMPDDARLEELLWTLKQFKEAHPGMAYDCFLENEHNREALLQFFDALLQRVRE